jgi:thymidylate synthase ThyX
MASLTWLPYDPALGLTVPPSLSAAGLEGVLRDADADARDLAGRFGADRPAAAYAWLNAHRRRAILTTNLREFYHISRLREDEHAQWDIRALVGAMSDAVRRAFPVCAALLGGKDRVGARLKTGGR